MKFIVDAHLPRRIVIRLNEAGHDAIHTSELPSRNQTTDTEILQISAVQKRIVVTKDSDFVHSFHLQGKPEKLLLISTGNISNTNLEKLLIPNLRVIELAFEVTNFVELTQTSVVLH